MRKKRVQEVLGKREFRDLIGYPKTVKEAVDKAARVDLGRQQQIQNQIKVIDGLKEQLQEAHAEIYGMKVAIWCVLWRYTQDLAEARGLPEVQESAEITIPRKDILEASAGKVQATSDAEGNMTVRITKESKDEPAGTQ